MKLIDTYIKEKLVIDKDTKPISDTQQEEIIDKIDDFLANKHYFGSKKGDFDISISTDEVYILCPLTKYIYERIEIIAKLIADNILHTGFYRVNKKTGELKFEI